MEDMNSKSPNNESNLSNNSDECEKRLHDKQNDESAALGSVDSSTVIVEKGGDGQTSLSPTVGERSRSPSENEIANKIANCGSGDDDNNDINKIKEKDKSKDAENSSNLERHETQVENESPVQASENSSSINGDIDDADKTHEKENSEMNVDENSIYKKEKWKSHVTSSDTFVELPSGPESPALVMSNPLESDREETSDSVRSDSLVNKDNCSSVDKSKSNSEPEEVIDIVDGEKSSDAERDNDQGEVITGDKTISPEFVKKNFGESPLAVMKDHQYTRKANGALSVVTDPKDGAPKRTLKVIYPKKKVIDVNQVKITKISIPLLKSCLQCSKISNCNIQVDIGGSECYLCSEECLRQHRTLQLNALRGKTSTSIPTDKQDISHESRLCVNCDTNVSILPEDKVVSWEAMEFCNEDCLGKYQLKMWSFCNLCKKEVPTSSMGKYCVRFGHEVKQFCCSSCLEEYKKGIKVCSYCQKDLSDGEGFLAPIGDKGTFRDFCSQKCLDDYDCMARNIPSGSLRVEACGVCDKKQLVQLQVITPNNNINLCSEVCFAAFKFVNKLISTVPCYTCKTYFDKTMPACVTIYFENELLSFCSKACMNINILSKRKIVACNWCKVKKYNFDMIRRKTSSGNSSNWCSVNCMTLYQVSMDAITHRSVMNCTYCKKLDVPHLHLTMSDATVRNFCSLECVNKFQATFASQGTPSNGVFPTGPPKRVVRPKAHGPSLTSDGSSPKNGSLKQSAGTPPSIPIVSIKKPESIKAIIPANGPIASGSMSPSQSSSIQQEIQQLRFQILVAASECPDVKNTYTQVKPHMLDKSVSMKSNLTVRSCQTETNEMEEQKEEGKEKNEAVDKKGPILVPIPIPIYVPCPMAMYSIPVPTPFPFPVPVAVPIFIPTTKGTAEEIFADIKRIQEKIPGNPIEAELIMMAEMAEGVNESQGKLDAERPSSSDATSEERRMVLKRPGDNNEGSDSNIGPPQKKRKENSGSIEAAIVQQVAISHVPMSLKETLGVSAWRHYALEVGEEKNLLEMRTSELAQALRGFILNAKLPSGNYTPDQKYYLALGIQYYLQENGRVENIFYDKLFDPFIDALNEEGKKFQEMFAQCDNVVTRVEEEHLWESKQLGPHSPATLLATLIYCNTKYFNLTTVEEHLKLSFSQIIKHWKRNPNSSPGNNSSSGGRNVLLRYYPPQSVLDADPKKKKIYEQEANDEDPYRCPIHLYDFYISKCPEIVKSKNDLFYMSPERSCVPDSPIWYSTLPLSPEIIERTLNRFKMVKEINLTLL